MKSITHIHGLICAALSGPIFFGLVISTLPVDAANANACPCFTNKMMTRSCTGGKRVRYIERKSREPADSRIEHAITVVCTGASGYVRYATQAVTHTDGKAARNSCESKIEKSVSKDLSHAQSGSCIRALVNFGLAWRRFLNCRNTSRELGNSGTGSDQYTLATTDCTLKPKYLIKGNYLKSR